jgi:hypothetical protein
MTNEQFADLNNLIVTFRESIRLIEDLKRNVELAKHASNVAEDELRDFITKLERGDL